MRMWMISPVRLCRNHLLGEHVEIHMFNKQISKGFQFENALKLNLLEPSSVKRRHDELVKEMIRRGYNHNSPLEPASISYLPLWQKNFRINIKKAAEDLNNRCKNCQIIV